MFQGKTLAVFSSSRSSLILVITSAAKRDTMPIIATEGMYQETVADLIEQHTRDTVMSRERSHFLAVSHFRAWMYGYCSHDAETLYLPESQ